MQIKIPVALPVLFIAAMLAFWGTSALNEGGSIEGSFPGFSVRIDGSR